MQYDFLLLPAIHQKHQNNDDAMGEKPSALRTKRLNGKMGPWTILLDVLLDAGKRAVLSLEEYPQKVRKKP